MAKKPTLTPEEARQEALKTALETIERKFGQGAVMKLSDDVHVKVPVIPTGSIGVDLALGIGGIPKGRVTEIYGPESSGKTTLTLHVIAECQKLGGTAAFIDAEHALDVTYARRLGVKTDELLISQPDHGEQALEIADMLVRSGAVDLVVIDSVAALIPQTELEGAMGETQVGGHARLMSHALRKLTGTIHKSRTAVIFINQIRMKIGVTGYGSPETTTGGNALKFYSSVRLDIRKHPDPQGQGRSLRLPYPREGGQKQDGPALPRSQVRHHLGHGHFPLRGSSSTSASTPASWTRAAHGSPSGPKSSARARKRSVPCSMKPPSCATPSRASSSSIWA